MGFVVWHLGGMSDSIHSFRDEYGVVIKFLPSHSAHNRANPAACINQHRGGGTAPCTFTVLLAEGGWDHWFRSGLSQRVQDAISRAVVLLRTLSAGASC